jgi:excisionase family DNA binding protein
MAREWKTINEIAAHLGVSGTTVRNMIRDGRLPAHRGLGRAIVRLDIDEVDAALLADS